jgi:hypothetical protein
MWLRMDGEDADISNTEKLVADPKSSPSWVSQAILRMVATTWLCEFPPRASMILDCDGVFMLPSAFNQQNRDEGAEPEVTDTRAPESESARRLCGNHL